MKNILANLLIKLGLDSNEFNNGIESAKSKTNAFGEGIKRLGAMMAAAFSVAAITAFGKEIIGLSGKVTGVANAFKKIEGSQAILSDLRDATRNTVDDLKLMQLAIQAKNFKMPLEQLPTLLKFASDRAIETGLSVEYLTESIISGIAKKSIPILDNLGISSVELQTEFAKTGDFAKAVANIIEREMSNAGEVLDTMGTRIQRISTKWENWKQKISTTPEFIRLVNQEITEIDDNMTVLLSDNISGWKKLLAFVDLTGNYMAKYAEEIRNAEKEQAKLINHVDQDSNAYRNNIAAEQDYIEAKKRNGRTINEIEEATANLEARLKTYGEFQQAEIQKTLQQIDANKKLIKSLTTIVEARKKQADMGGMISTRTELPTIAAPLSGASGLGDTSFFQKAQLDKADEMYSEYMQSTWNFVEQMKAAAVDFGINVVEEMGSAFGELAATGKFPDDFGKNVLAIIGSFISQLGEMLIGLGIASEAFQALLKTAFTNPVSAGLAIAAGAALVLMGGAISGMAKAGPGGSSSSGVTTSAYSSANNSGQTHSTNGTVEFVIKGNTLVGVLENQNRKNGLIG